MCLIAWNWQPASDTPLLLIGNRDEFYSRPSTALQWWADADILAGRDVQAGGTWLGVNRHGCLAALTNYRDPLNQRVGTPSRGELVAGFLKGSASAPSYLTALAQRCAGYNPFNLLVYDGQRLMGLESRHARVLDIAPGIGAVSNADFQTPWPKLTALKVGLQLNLEQAVHDDAEWLSLLHNASQAPDSALPRTGIALDRERALSAAFIATPDYGTRACSVVRLQRHRAVFLEETFNAVGRVGVQSQAFDLLRENGVEAALSSSA